MNPGYEHNVAAATAILDWLSRYDIDATLHHAIKRLLAMAHNHESSEATS